PAIARRALALLLVRSFFLSRRYPPRATFSPSTTLFRSLPLQAGLVTQHIEPRPGQQQRHPAVGLKQFLGQAQTVNGARSPGDGEDRKSTRLNSSHVKNSYAVFCLKKKNEFHARHPSARL